MNTTTAEGDELVSEAATAVMPETPVALVAPAGPRRGWPRPRWPRPGWPDVWRAGLAVALMALGGALLATNLGLLAPEAERAVAMAWPAGLILGGLGLLLAGDRWVTALTPFTVERNQVEQAGLLTRAGTADLRLTALEAAGGNSAGAELAAGALPWRGGPQIEQQDQSLTLRLEPDWALPAWRGAAEGQVALARGVPWRLNLRSSTGNLEVDLAELEVAEVRLHSTLGDVHVTLPAAGGTDLEIGLALGDLRVTVPEGLGVKVKLRRGALADASHDERRFIRLSPDEVGTPLYAVAARRCTLSVWLGTGSLRLE